MWPGASQGRLQCNMTVSVTASLLKVPMMRNIILRFFFSTIYIVSRETHRRHTLHMGTPEKECLQYLLIEGLGRFLFY